MPDFCREGERDGTAPRAEVDGDRICAGHSAQHIDRELGNLLGFWTGYENSGPDGKLQRAKRCLPGDVLKRLTAFAPGHQFEDTCGVFV